MANLENLKKVREVIVKFKNKFNYLYYYTDSLRLSPTGEASFISDASIKEIESVISGTDECGTCACVAGFCVSLSNVEKPFNATVVTCWDAAKKWLGLLHGEDSWLFEPEALKLGKKRYLSNNNHLSKFKYDPVFPGSQYCTQEQGYNEALRRLDFLIEHYSKEEQNGKRGESQKGS
jgi:hypothetical protein